MEFCTCEKDEWAKSRLVDRVRVHSACGFPLKCSKCNRRAAINLGAAGAECESCSPLFSDEFFSAHFDLEKGLFDGFIYHVGGVRVLNLLNKPPDFNNVDYYFQSEDVLVELKLLKTEFARTPEHREKFEKLMLNWLKEGRLTKAQFLGIEPPPNGFVKAHMALLRKSIEKITNKANKQIKQTKQKFGLSTARGIVLYLIDGFYQANPGLTIALIGDPLTRQMSSVDAYVVFNLRNKITLPEEAFEGFFWEPKYRNTKDIKLSKFVNRLGAEWFLYMQHLSGMKFSNTFENDDPGNTILSRAEFKIAKS